MRAAGTGRWAAAAGGLMMLAGCVQFSEFGTEIVACATGDESTPAKGVILMAQAVPTATWVPCLNGLPLGWSFSDLNVRRDSAQFLLGSDRYGMPAIQVGLTETCDTAGATAIPSDREGMLRMEKVTQVTPQFHGRRFYLFEGGCITVVFTLSGDDRSEPLGVATQELGVVPRDDLRDLVRDNSDGRLSLDPAEGG